MEQPKRKSKKPKLKIDYERAEALAARGLSKEHIALCLGMSPSTLYAKQIDDPKFKEAIDKGQAAGVAAVTGELFKQIKAGSMTGIALYLKCKAGWKETQVIEQRKPPVLPDEDCSPEEAEAAYIASMRLLK